MKNIKQQKIKRLTDINSRKIVIHHTHILGYQLILYLLKDGDIVFFDDCLYSQYLFIKNHIKELQLKNIVCILGFSTQIYRTDQIPIIEDSAILHNKVHANDYAAFGGFMSIEEIKELLRFDNVFLAGHGAKHLHLEKMNLSKIQQSKLFIQDINIMKNDLDNLNLQTDIFVFPYAYDDFPCAKKSVNNIGFKHIFASKDSKRIEIENLL